jgi:hypothetical protein
LLSCRLSYQTQSAAREKQRRSAPDFESEEEVNTEDDELDDVALEEDEMTESDLLLDVRALEVCGYSDVSYNPTRVEVSDDERVVFVFLFGRKIRSGAHLNVCQS